MFKILILQTIYNVSYKEIEFQIIDRACFKRFLGLTKKDDVPSHKDCIEL